MARAVLAVLIAAALAMPAAARGPRGVGHPQHGHPINAWHGSGGHIHIR